MFVLAQSKRRAITAGWRRRKKGEVNSKRKKRREQTKDLLEEKEKV